MIDLIFQDQTPFFVVPLNVILSYYLSYTKKAHHAEAGSRFLQRLGFPKTADIAAAHMDLTPGPALDETQIVFFADKRCRGDRLDLDYPGRFHEKANRLPHELLLGR